MVHQVKSLWQHRLSTFSRKPRPVLSTLSVQSTYIEKALHTYTHIHTLCASINWIFGIGPFAGRYTVYVMLHIAIYPPEFVSSNIGPNIWFVWRRPPAIAYVLFVCAFGGGTGGWGLVTNLVTILHTYSHTARAQSDWGCTNQTLTRVSSNNKIPCVMGLGTHNPTTIMGYDIYGSIMRGHIAYSIFSLGPAEPA